MRTLKITLASVLCSAAVPAATSLDLAAAEIKTGHYQSAVSLLQSAPATEHNSAEWHGMLSQCYEMLSQPKEAVEQADEALSVQPGQERWWIQLGRIFLRFHTPQAAVEVYSDTLARFPDSLAARLGRGLAYKDLQQVDPARADLEECLRRSPGLGLAFEGLASAEMEAKQYTDVIAAAEAFRKGNSDDMRSYYYEAAARDELAPDDQHIDSLLREALGRAPSFAAAYTLLGRVLLERHQAAAALEPLRRAVSLRPDYSPTYLYLAKAYRALEQPAEAKRALDNWKRARDAENAPVMTLTYHRQLQR